MRSVCSCSRPSSSAVSGRKPECSEMNSSICACIRASGVRSSCAALPVNWRCAENPSPRRAIMSLKEALHRCSSAGTSSLSLISLRLSGCTRSTWAAKARSGLSARPLTKYASTPPRSVTPAVMRQAVVPKDSCASFTTIVTSLSRVAFVGSNAWGESSLVAVKAEMSLPMASM